MTRTAAAAALAACLLLGCWSLVHHTTPQHSLIIDTPIYKDYGDNIVHGKVPYRDFRLEYPPAALPMFVLPSLAHSRGLSGYERWFDREMAVCACLALLGVVLITRAPPALAIVAAAPLLLGPVVLSRFDYWPAALTVLSLAAFLRSRLALAAVILGVAIGAKLWPAVILPVLALHLWRTGRRRAAAWLTVGVTAVVAVIFLPFIVLSPSGVGYSFHRQLARPLQIESLGGAVLVAVHHVFGTAIGTEGTFGSQNVIGPGAHIAAILSTTLLALALLFVWTTSRDVVAGSAASVAAFLAFGKVFSPQFMIWLVPLVPLVPRLGVQALLVVALLLTQSWFPRDYWHYVNSLAMRESAEVLARDVVVVALFAVLAIRAMRRARAAPRPSAAEVAAAPRP